jgi:7-cyano-7-deazaguanine synthase
MCGIFGFIGLKPLKGMTGEMIRRARSSTQRGRDGFGITAFYDNSPSQTLKSRDVSAGSLSKIKIDGAVGAIGATRGEPTTEFVTDKNSLADIQPFELDGWHVVHNGVIANDNELVEKNNFRKLCAVDSSILPSIFSRCGFYDGILRLKGSWAIAAWHEGSLYLSCNYKPIYLKRIVENGHLIGVVFASLFSYLQDSWNDNIIKLEPYTMATITPKDGSLNMTRYSLRVHKKKKNCLVICSGGLDSTVVATKYAREGHNVTLLHFTYGCKAQMNEVQAVKKIADALGCQVKYVDMSSMFLGDIGGSPLLDDRNIEHSKGGIAGAEYAIEWVPARNLVFLSAAIAYAEANGFDTIALGNNMEEGGAYPDNEMEFINAMNVVMPNAVKDGVQITIEQPVGGLMKKEIVSLGLDLRAPFEHTWSCYHSGEKHCGTCGPCWMRRKAFEVNGAVDPVFGG